MPRGAAMPLLPQLLYAKVGQDETNDTTVRFGLGNGMNGETNSDNSVVEVTSRSRTLSSSYIHRGCTKGYIA